MNTPPDLHELYQEWKALTETEGDAIRENAWDKVHTYQARKTDLQSKIINAARVAPGGLSAGTGGARRDQSTTQQIVRELIQLENRNLGWLAARRREAQAQLEKLAGGRLNLRNVQRAYTGLADVAWQSYS